MIFNPLKAFRIDSFEAFYWTNEKLAIVDSLKNKILMLFRLVSYIYYLYSKISGIGIGSHWTVCALFLGDILAVFTYA
jgi:hypothetical protein